MRSWWEESKNSQCSRPLSYELHFSVSFLKVYFFFLWAWHSKASNPIHHCRCDAVRHMKKLSSLSWHFKSPATRVACCERASQRVLTNAWRHSFSLQTFEGRTAGLVEFRNQGWCTKRKGILIWENRWWEYREYLGISITLKACSLCSKAYLNWQLATPRSKRGECIYRWKWLSVQYIVSNCGLKQMLSE